MEPAPECFEMIDGGEHNPYHFLFYMLSNFLITDVNKKLIYYYPNKKDCKVSEGFLQLLPPNFIRHTTKQPGINYKPFISTIPIYADVALPESYNLVRHLFKNYMAPELKMGKSIYIQRKAGETRTLINEKDVQRVLESNGYETIILENYEIKEQIRIVSEAEYIIGAHGAGFAFTVFCNPHAKVIEICGKNSVTKHYYHIAWVLGHRIFRFQDVIINEDDNTLVNLKELDAFLKLWHCSRLF